MLYKYIVKNTVSFLNPALKIGSLLSTYAVSPSFTIEVNILPPIQLKIVSGLKVASKCIFSLFVCIGSTIFGYSVWGISA